MMIGDDDEDKIEPLSEEELKDVQGGRTIEPTTITGKLSGGDLLDGVNNDTLFAGPGDDNNFNIGMPPTYKKR